MKRILYFMLIALATLLSSEVTFAKSGASRARQYFAKDAEEIGSGSYSGPRYLALHYGQFVNSTAYKWGKKDSEKSVGQRTYGVTYRVGEWVNSMDLLFRGEFCDYEADGFYNQKLSFSPVVTFPDAKAGFPLYFGAGAGMGVFFRQMEKESSLTFDYQLVMGARFNNIYDGFGFSIETGLKNHLSLLSDGQFNGTFLAAGAVFEF